MSADALQHARREKIMAKTYWLTPERVERSRDTDTDGEWIRVTFVEGGTVDVFTTAPLVWSAPQEH